MLTSGVTEIFLSDSVLIFEALVQIGVHTPRPTEIISSDERRNNLIDALEIIRDVSAESLYGIEELIDTLGLCQFVFEIAFDLLKVTGIPNRCRACGKLSFDKHSGGAVCWQAGGLGLPC